VRALFSTVIAGPPLDGATRQSILFRKMDARIKSGHDASNADTQRLLVRARSRMA